MEENAKLVFDELSKKKAKIEKKLYTNALTQIAAIVIGLSYVFRYEIFIGSFVKEYLKVEDKVVQIALPVVLLYLFIDFGYSVGQLFFLNKVLKSINQKIIDDFCRKNKLLKRTDLAISFNSINIFNQLQGHNTSPQGKAQTFISRLIIFIVVTANHFTVLKLVEFLLKDNDAWRIGFKLFLGALLVFFHIQYNSSNKKNHYSPMLVTRTISACAILIVAYFIINELFPALKF